MKNNEELMNDKSKMEIEFKQKDNDNQQKIKELNEELEETKKQYEYYKKQERIAAENYEKFRLKLNNQKKDFITQLENKQTSEQTQIHELETKIQILEEKLKDYEQLKTENINWRREHNKDVPIKEFPHLIAQMKKKEK